LIDIIYLSLKELRLKTVDIQYFKTAQQTNKIFLLGFGLLGVYLSF
jgi:hypothetical protein